VRAGHLLAKQTGLARDGWWDVDPRRGKTRTYGQRVFGWRTGSWRRTLACWWRLRSCRSACIQRSPSLIFCLPSLFSSELLAYSSRVHGMLLVLSVSFLLFCSTITNAAACHYRQFFSRTAPMPPCFPPPPYLPGFSLTIRSMGFLAVPSSPSPRHRPGPACSPTSLRMRRFAAGVLRVVLRAASQHHLSYPEEHIWPSGRASLYLNSADGAFGQVRDARDFLRGGGLRRVCSLGNAACLGLLPSSAGFLLIFFCWKVWFATVSWTCARLVLGGTTHYLPAERGQLLAAPAAMLYILWRAGGYTVLWVLPSAAPSSFCRFGVAVLTRLGGVLRTGGSLRGYPRVWPRVSIYTATKHCVSHRTFGFRCFLFAWARRFFGFLYCPFAP